jgi:signal transduction histidine kinase
MLTSPPERYPARGLPAALAAAAWNSLLAGCARFLRSAAAPKWSATVKAWTSYPVPAGKSSDDHLLATLMHRIIFVLTVEGLILILPVSRLLGRRMFFQGIAYLFLVALVLLLRRRYGTRVAYIGTYCFAGSVMVFVVSISGGVYSWSVMPLIILTATLAFVIQVRTALFALGALLSLLGIMGAFQAHGIWFPRIVTPAPGTTAALLVLSTMNITVPIVTAIQAYRQTLAQLETKVGELDAAEAETRKLLDAQSRFFWDVSHELRSPLTRLNLSLGKVRRESGPPAEPSLDRMENEVERLNKLIHQLLLLAQLKQGVQFPMNQRFDLAAEVAAVCEDAEFEANVAGRDFTVQCDSACPVEGCAELLRGALDNVVRNAIRFAPEGSEVEVRLSQPGAGMASIAVADRGPGVPESQIARLFDPFFRVVPDGNGSDANAPLHRSGSGLGLAIAFEAVKKHGGRISALNRPGGGLLVTMEIPTRVERTSDSPNRIDAHASAGE